MIRFPSALGAAIQAPFLAHESAGSCRPADAVLSKRNADLILTKKISLQIQVSNCVETVGHNSFWK
jgi:hypothetical protein